MSEAYDYSEFKEEVGDNILAVLRHAAQEQLDAERDVAAAQEKLDEKKAALRDISENKLPQLMQDAQQTKITTADGVTVELKEKIRASIPAKNPEPSMNDLEARDQGGMIKRTFVIDFGKDDDAWAKKFERDLKARKKPLNVKRTKTVHPGTLTKWIKESLEDGVDFDKTLYNVFQQKVTTVKISTKEKA